MATGSVVTLCPATQITFSASALKPWSSNVIDTTCGYSARGKHRISYCFLHNARKRHSARQRTPSLHTVRTDTVECLAWLAQRTLHGHYLRPYRRICFCLVVGQDHHVLAAVHGLLNALHVLQAQHLRLLFDDQRAHEIVAPTFVQRWSERTVQHMQQPLLLPGYKRYQAVLAVIDKLLEMRGKWATSTHHW
jgi:hypothetical protein